MVDWLVGEEVSVSREKSGEQKEYMDWESERPERRGASMATWAVFVCVKPNLVWAE